MNRKQIFIGIGIVALVLLLGGAAFVGAQLIGDPERAESQIADAAGRGGRVMEMVTDDGSGNARSMRVIVEPSPDLPDAEADENGVFIRRSDNSIFVGTGNIMVDVEMDESGVEDLSVASDGPEVEIVFTRDTVILEDITDMSEIGESATNGEVVIQQEVAPAESIEEIQKNCELQIWGEKRGDRLVAQTIVFRNISLDF